MKPEKQRIAIAEACGKSIGSDCWYHEIAGNERVHSCVCPCEGTGWNIPDYLNDLNAMREAVKTINSSWTKYGDYITALRKIVAIENSSSDNCTPPYCSEVDATAAQRAEAFLRTIGKWEEE